MEQQSQLKIGKLGSMFGSNLIYKVRHHLDDEVQHKHI